MTDDTLGDLIETLGSVDHDEIDWANVRRATYLVRQHFGYAYPGPIQDLRQRLMIVPPDWHEDQRLVTHKLGIAASNVSLERSYDTFGNVIVDISVDHVPSSIDFTAWIVLERETSVDGSDEREPLVPDLRLLQPTELTAPDDALRRVADDLRAEGLTGLALAERVNARVHEHFEYRYGVTSVATGAAEAWAGGVGVCQDYAHAMLALCRLLGLPARYVSGHLLGEGGTHAWVEVLLPHSAGDDLLAAHAFDPTHARRTGLKYLTVAVGRDYADVPPTSGTFEAPYAGELTTHKRAAVTRVEYVRPRRRRRAVAGGR